MSTFLKKSLFVCLLFLAILLVFPSKSFAQAVQCPTNFQVGDCYRNKICQLGNNGTLENSGAQCGCPAGSNIGDCHNGVYCIYDPNNTNNGLMPMGARCGSACLQVGQCLNGQTCELGQYGYVDHTGPACGGASPIPTPVPCTLNTCVNGRLCVVLVPGQPPVPFGQGCGSGIGSAVIGRVAPPFSIFTLNSQAGPNGQGNGILLFANRVVLLITIIAGILVMFNFIKAGWLYLLGGAETKAAAEVKDLLTYSIIGLVIIAVTYTIAGLIGYIFFGNAAFILQPTLYSALDIW